MEVLDRNIILQNLEKIIVEQPSNSFTVTFLDEKIILFTRNVNNIDYDYFCCIFKNITKYLKNNDIEHLVSDNYDVLVYL